MVVRPSRMFANPDWIFCSVSVSILAVASSNTKILGSRKIDRANDNNCFCPVENAAPPSITLA